MQITLSNQARPLNQYPLYWAECFGTAPVLPVSLQEMEQLGWDSCDIIIVTGDAYVDHPSFGMAIIGRLLEAQGFRVGIIAQPEWLSAEPFTALGKPNLFFGVTAGNMDSMINRYTADRKIRTDDAYSPDDIGGRRPDRCSVVYAQRCREAYRDVPILLGGIEASLRRIAHYDYWQDKVRRSILADAKADMLIYGNGERAIAEIAYRLSQGEDIAQINNVRGTAFAIKDLPPDWRVLDSTNVEKPGRVEQPLNPYEVIVQPASANSATSDSTTRAVDVELSGKMQKMHHRLDRRLKTVIRLPSFNDVDRDPVLYAHANRVLHMETNPGNAMALVQNQGGQKIWLNPPPIPLTTEEMDFVFGFDYARIPHPVYQGRKIPAYEMIRFSINIMRGCFGGCTFCSITEHEGRIIQNRSEDSIIREIEIIRDKVPGFTGVISDLGGPTANMYRLACNSKMIEAACRRASCVFPAICPNLNTDHSALIGLYRRARELEGVKKVLISSGLRYDLAVESPEYVEQLVSHHVGGYLKIAPEHTEQGPLSKMMKPGMGSYDRFKSLFDKFSKKAGKEQYLIPYFIAAHPGTTDEDMMNLAIWLKQNGFKADQVQNFYPSPMATATAMYHTAKNPLKRVKRDEQEVPVPKGERQRRLHKAFLRYHDPDNWPLLREALKLLGRSDLIGSGKHQLIPVHQPSSAGNYHSPRRKNSYSNKQGGKIQSGKKRILTQHTGLPPRNLN